MIAKERLDRKKGKNPPDTFFNLEKRNYNRKTINELRKHDGVEIREEKEILKVIQEFYEDMSTPLKYPRHKNNLTLLSEI